MRPEYDNDFYYPDSGGDDGSTEPQGQENSVDAKALEELEELESEEEKEQQEKRELLFEMHRKYHAGEISKQEYAEFMVNMLDNYIKMLIKITHKLEAGTVFSYDDFLQEGRLAVIKKLDGYDPRKAMPTTYFRDHINGDMNKLIKSPSESGKTMHYTQCINRIKRVLEEHGMDIDDPDLPLPDLQAWMNETKTKNPYSLATIREAIRVHKNRVVSLDDMLDPANEHRSERPIMDIPSPFLNPEEACLKAEKAEVILKQLSYLTPLEKFVLSRVDFGEQRSDVISDEYTKEYVAAHGKKVDIPDAALSLSDLCKLLNDDKLPYGEMFAPELKGVKITQAFLRATASQAIRRLRYNKSFTSYHGVKNVDFVEQAMDSDIDRAMSLMDAPLMPNEF